jgi:hypothetical protein
MLFETIKRNADRSRKRLASGHDAIHIHRRNLSLPLCWEKPMHISTTQVILGRLWKATESMLPMPMSGAMPNIVEMPLLMEIRG